MRVLFVVRISPLFLLLCSFGLQEKWSQAAAASADVGHHLENQTTTLLLLSFLPYLDPDFAQQPSWIEGPTLILAEQMAIELLNERKDILPGYRLKLVQRDSGCNLKTRATLAIVEGVLANKEEEEEEEEEDGQVVGVIGPGCSTSASVVGQITGRSATSLLNIHGAGSLELEKREVFPNSYGTLASTKVFVYTLLNLFDLGQWKRVAAFYDESRLYYTSTVLELQTQLRERNSTSNLISAVYPTYFPLKLVQNRYRVVVLLVGPDFLSRILCLSLHYNLRYPVYQFVIVSRVAKEIGGVKFRYDGKDYVCSDNEIQEMIVNITVIHYQLHPLNHSHPTSSGLSYNQFIQMYHKRIRETENDDTEPSFWAPAFFDATWTLGLVLNSSLPDVDLSRYRYGNKHALEIFKEKIEELVIDGVSGLLRFNNNTGYVQRNVDIYRVQGNKSMEVMAYYNILEGSISSSHDLELISGDFDQVEVIYSVSKTLGALSLVVAVAGLTLTFLLQCLTLYGRNYNSVKAASPKLAQLAFTGCYLLGLGSVFNTITTSFVDVISPEVNCYLWNVLNVVTSAGPVLIYVTICVRTWRLYRIFVHYNDPGKFMSERFLILFVVSFFAASLAVTVIWTATDPFSPYMDFHETKLREHQDSKNKTVRLEVVKTVFRSCRQREEYFVVWVLFLVLLNSILMGAAFVLAILTRHIHQRNFKTHQVMMFTYALSGLLGIGIPAYFILLHDATAILTRFIISTILLNTYTFLACFLLFLPPLCPFFLSLKVIAKFKLKVTTTNTRRPRSSLKSNGSVFE